MKQQEFFNTFWKSSGGYVGQNMFLSTLLKKKPSTTTQNIESEVTSWEYCFNSISDRTIVCQNFLCILLDIKRGRFTTIQNKLKNNEWLEDNRDKHKKQVERLTDEIKTMINEHCLSIPHYESHYISREHSSLKYFDHLELTFNKLYKLFVEYYISKTGNLNAPIKA